LPVSRETASRDTFAGDCQHSHLVARFPALSRDAANARQEAGIPPPIGGSFSLPEVRERVTAKERDVFPSLSLVGIWEVTLGEAQLVTRSDVHHLNSFLPGTSMKFRYADESCERDILEIE